MTHGLAIFYFLEFHDILIVCYAVLALTISRYRHCSAPLISSNFLQEFIFSVFSFPSTSRLCLLLSFVPSFFLYSIFFLLVFLRLASCQVGENDEVARDGVRSIDQPHERAIPRPFLIGQYIGHYGEMPDDWGFLRCVSRVKCEKSATCILVICEMLPLEPGIVAVELGGID